MSAPSGTEPEPYGDVRGRLVALGYLERPLDRYVLGGLVRTGSFPIRHAVVSARVALATAPLLGLLSALAVAWVYRPRFSRPDEILWLALDFTLVFGAAIFLLEWLAGLLLAAWVRWRGRGVAGYHATAARAGFAVSLMVSAYLAFWWRRRVGGTEGLLPDAIGLLLLLLVNAALLRISSLASLAALIRASDLPPAPAQRGSSRHGLVAAVGAALLVLVFVLAPKSRRADEAPGFVRTPVHGRILVIAWDGIPLELYRRVRPSMPAWSGHDDASKGEARTSDVPGGSARAGSSASARGLLVPMSPAPEGRSLSRPAFWTEVATGRRAADHGVEEISDRRLVGLSSPLGGDVPLGEVLKALLPGTRVAVSAGLRRALTVWEILAEYEGVGVVGWWATWPAIERGTASRPFAVVSDRAILSLEVPAPHGHGIVPETLAREISVHFQEDLEAARSSFQQKGPKRGFRGDDPRTLAPGREEQASLIDGWTAEVAERLQADPRIVSLFVYFPGLDIVRALEEGSADGSATERAGSATDRVEAFSRYVLERIDHLASSLGPEDWLVVLGDPGRAGDRDLAVSSNVDHRSGGGQRETRESGEEGGAWVSILGPGVNGAVSSPAPWSPLDVAPTLLNLRGFPVSEQMPGSARVDFLLSEWQDRLRPRQIPTYGDNAVPALPTRDPSSEEEILERLRSLGYLN